MLNKPTNFLPLFTLCFCLGICLVKLRYIPFMILYLGCWSLLVLSLVFLKKEWSGLLLLILGIFLGGLILKNFYIISGSHIAKLTAYKSQTVLLKGIVDSCPQIKSRYTSFVLAVEKLTQGNKVYGVTGKVLARVYDKENVSYGQRVLLKGKLSRPYGRPNRRFSYRDYLKAQRIYSILTLSSNAAIKYLGLAKTNPLKGLVYRIRDMSRNIYFKYLPKTQAGILSAMLLGDRSLIPPYIKRLFVQTGTIHILAISGLHVGIIVFTLDLFFKVLSIKRRGRFVIIILCLPFYCLLAGARPSVIRATIMAIILLLGFLLNRRVSISYSLSLAGLIILIVNPYQLFNIGFQLSFLSILSIAYIYPKIKNVLPYKNYKPRILKFIVDAFCVSLAVWLALWAVIAYYFRIITPVTVLANMVIVPYISIVISLGIILILAGMLLPIAAPLFSATTNLALVILVYIIEFFNQLPCAYFYL